MASDTDGDHVPRTDGPDRRPRVLATLVFALLLAQPVAVFALAVLSADPATLGVIAAGSVLLAVPTARVFFDRGGSVSRLSDFLLTLAFVQVAFVACSQVLFAVAPTSVGAAAQPAVVVAAYPVAYHVVYRGAPVSPLDLVSDDRN